MVTLVTNYQYTKPHGKYLGPGLFWFLRVKEYLKINRAEEGGCLLGEGEFSMKLAASVFQKNNNINHISTIRVATTRFTTLGRSLFSL